MALARLDKANGVNTAAAASATTGSFTPPNNSLLVAIWQCMRTATSTYNPQNSIPSDTAGLTWTQRKEAHGASDNYGQGLVCFTAPVTTGVSMTATLTKATGDADYERIGWHILSYTGYDVASPIGGSLGFSTGPGDGAYSPSLSAVPALTSEVIAAICGTCNTTLDVYPIFGTGWSSLLTRNEIQYYGYADEVRVNSATQTILWDDVLGPASTDTYNLGVTYGIALEIKAAAEQPFAGPYPNDAINQFVGDFGRSRARYGI